MPIGGRDKNPFVMLEVHYNNPNLIEGMYGRCRICNSSGKSVFIYKLELSTFCCLCFVNKL